MFYIFYTQCHILTVPSENTLKQCGVCIMEMMYSFDISKKKKKSFCILNDYIYVDNNCIPCGPYINYTIRELEMCGQSEIHRLMLVTC